MGVSPSASVPGEGESEDGVSGPCWLSVTAVEVELGVDGFRSRVLSGIDVRLMVSR